MKLYKVYWYDHKPNKRKISEQKIFVKMLSDWGKGKFVVIKNLFPAELKKADQQMKTIYIKT